MRRHWVLVAVLGALALASTASLLAGLRNALRREPRAEKLDPPEAERQRIREALGDMLAPPIDFSEWPEQLRPRSDLPDRDTLRRSMPTLDPPLSHTVREERDESRY